MLEPRSLKDGCEDCLVINGKKICDMNCGLAICPECGQPLHWHDKTMAQIHVERYNKYKELQKQTARLVKKEKKKTWPSK